MAYVGNPSDLTKQAAPTTPGEDANLWQPLLAAIVVMAVIVVVAMAPVLNKAKVFVPLDDERGVTSFSIAPTSIVPVDRTLEQSATLQAGVSRMVFQAPLSLAADNSLANAEKLLSAASTFTPKSFAPTDHSLAKAERLQSDVSGMVYQAVAPVDHRYDNIENLRGNLR